MHPDDACEVVVGDVARGLLLTCEHASRDLPSGWTWPREDRWLLDTHWSHDIGAETLAREVASATGAPLVLAQFSRLLVDPNRPPSSPTLVRDRADGKRIALNANVDEAERARRVPYWAAYHAQVARHASLPAITTIFAVHSFTETYEGQRRDFEIGVLFDEEEELAEELARALRHDASVRLNEPYSGKEGMIYAAHRHATEHGLRAVEIEVRQDRIVDAAFRAAIVKAVASVFALVVVLLVRGAQAAPRVYAIDGTGRVAPAGRVHASLQRKPPSRVPPDVTAPHGDPDAMRYMLAGPLAEIPSIVDISSVDEEGTSVATLRHVALQTRPCPAAVKEEACAVTDPIRVVADAVDAAHPLVRARSVEGELGGALRIVGAGGVTLALLRVTGPRKMGFERLRGRLRFVAVRLAPGGALPVGGTEAGVRQAAVAALERVNALWGACGISFGPPDEVDLMVVDPPPSHLLSVGCDHGLPASGGELRFRVGHAKADGPGSHVTVPVVAGDSPAAVARRVARRLRRSGWAVRVSDNPPIASAAGSTTDLSVRSPSGALARLDPPASGDVSTDATLGACIGSVNMEDGLLHFTDVDSTVGTVEERTLVKAFDDFDPQTVDVFLITGFGRGGRIGESFISADGGTVRNVVIVDRAGIRSNQASFTLAHELGHVLLDDPGHPDDFGVDLPTRLMDADSADASAFGPRRLSLDECRRALMHSGPAALTPLLTPWPLAPLKIEASPAAWQPMQRRPWVRAFW